MQNLQDVPKNRMGLYIVQAGESVYSISKKYSIPPLLLICSNNLKGEITTGNMLVLPKCNGKMYTVQVGESVESLCQKFSITKEEFQQKNGCNYIFPGLLVQI